MIGTAYLTGMCVGFSVSSWENYVSISQVHDLSNIHTSYFSTSLWMYNFQWFSKEFLLILLAISLLIILVLGFKIVSFKKDNEGKKALNESLRKKSDSLISANNDIQRFIRVVSHDLRSPLNSISAISELMTMEAEEIPPKEIEQYAGNIYDLTLRIDNLVNNMRDANKIDLGEVALDLQPVQTVALAKEAYDSLKVLGDKKSITTNLSIEDNIPNINADQDALKRVLENLINNAYKFSNEGSTVEINVQYLKEIGKVKISISDEGPGFTQDDRKKLYGKFSKLSAAPTGGEKTTGLGLFIVKNLVERMNGSIELESTPGKGSVFSVILDEAK
jgi:signal transduction histidine kinase